MSRPEAQHTKWLRELLKKFPNTSQRAVARMAYGENPQWWKNYDNCRRNVRTICGTSGKRNRKHATDKSLYRAPCDEPADFMPPPLSEWSTDWDLVPLERGHKWLVLPDVHIPFHDRKALQAAIDHGKDKGCDAVLLLGDFLDFYNCSRFDKAPNIATLRDERDMCIEALAGLRDHFPDAGNMVWLLGNHEERWEKYLIAKAEELFSIPDFELAEVMRAGAFGFRVIGGKRPLTIGKLHLIHGHEFARGWYNPVNPARGLFLRAKVTACAAHNHQSSFHPERALSQVVIGCWSFGCLCQLHPKYMPINKWNHGFGIIDDTAGKKGQWRLSNYRIEEGKILEA